MANTATRASAKPAAATTKPATTKPATTKPAAATAAKAEPKNEVATRPANALSAETMASVPAHMRQDVNLGKENIRPEDLEIPRLKLMQGLSPELELYNELRPGMFFHTSSETIFDEAVRVVPVWMDVQYILWRPRDDGGGILARAADGVHWSPSQGEFEVKLDKKDGGAKVTWKLAKTVEQSGLANWGTMNPADPDSPPAATKMYNYVFAFPDYPDLMPAVLSFQRSSLKVGRQFNTKIRSVPVPPFGTVWNLSSVSDANSANQSFHNLSLSRAGLVDQDLFGDKAVEMYEFYKSQYMGFKNMGLNIKDLESLQTEGADNSAGAAPEGQPNY